MKKFLVICDEDMMSFYLNDIAGEMEMVKPSIWNGNYISTGSVRVYFATASVSLNIDDFDYMYVGPVHLYELLRKITSKIIFGYKDFVKCIIKAVKEEEVMPPKNTEINKIYIKFEDATYPVNRIENVELHPVTNVKMPDILEVIYNGPATIVKWSDNTKTVVKLQEKYKGKKNKEPYSKEKGLAMAICKKLYGNNNKYYDIFKKFEAEE